MDSGKRIPDPHLQDMRKSIDNLDIAFIRLLAERMRVVEKILFLKNKQKLDLSPSSQREEDVLNLLQISEQLNLDKHFFRKILDHVFESAIDQFQQKNDDATMELLCSDLLLEDLRINLLNVEKSICHLLTERFRVVKRIGKYKKQHKIAPHDPERWKQVLTEKKKIARSLDLHEPMIERVFNSIHEVA
ncbi:MAG: hypothetical protein GY786_12055, partial [Proteobacteria bacterium]|nr:hypothetical protein [Pseudomonadota bacterium]